MGFLGGSDGKESACNAGDAGSIPGSVRSPGEGNSYPLQYSCLENSMDIGTWQATIHRVTVRHYYVTNTHAHTHTVLSLANIFFHSVTVFLFCCKALKFSQIPFFCFCFCFLFFKRQIQKISLQFMSKYVILVFSSRSVMVFGLTFKSLVHFDLFLYVV